MLADSVRPAYRTLAEPAGVGADHHGQHHGHRDGLVGRSDTGRDRHARQRADGRGAQRHDERGGAFQLRGGSARRLHGQGRAEGLPDPRAEGRGLKRQREPRARRHRVADGPGGGDGHGR